MKDCVNLKHIAKICWVPNWADRIEVNVPVTTAQVNLLLAFSGFLEEGRHRRLERSSSRKKNRWYCREFERIFISSEPFCMNVRQSAAGKGRKCTHLILWTNTANTYILWSPLPLIIRLSSGRAMNETDFCSVRFEFLPSFLSTLDFLGMTAPGICSMLSSFSSETTLSPFAIGESFSFDSFEGKSAISGQKAAKNHGFFLRMYPTVLIAANSAGAPHKMIRCKGLGTNIKIYKNYWPAGFSKFNYL